MRGKDFPVVKDIVLLGGGHAHVAVLRRFGMSPIDGVRLTLISPEAHTPYSGMLPGLVAGHYTYDETHIDLGPLARFARARHLQTAATRVDGQARVVHLDDGRPPVPYDVLSINTGSTPVFDDALTLDRDVIPVKPVSSFLAAWEGMKARVLAEPARRIGVVGAGAGGVELLLSMQYALATAAGKKHDDGGPGRFHLFTRDDAILASHGDGVKEAMRAALDARGVTVHTGFDATGVTDSAVSDGTRMIATDEVIWVTGAEAPAWFAASGLDVDGRGFLSVDAQLRSTSHKEIFGAGDAVTMVRDPRPKSGVFAVRQGPVLAHNLRAAVLGQPLKRYRPQKAFLGLISTGDKFAVASYARRSVSGEWVWRWKDSIDRRFMARFNDLPPMTERSTTLPRVKELPPDVEEAVTPGAMRCGGCGAKVGAAVLARALAATGVVGGNADHRACASCGEILLRAGDDAAAFIVPSGMALVQTIDSFPAMTDDPYVFGQIAANHCLGDIFAMGAKPHSALAAIALPFAPAAKREADLMQLIAGARVIFDEVGCPILGGHTSEGSELSLGFSINGIAAPDELVQAAGLKADQALILTKPVGTGAIFAADGRGQAKGRWTAGAIDNALISNAAAADILRAHGASAMTDVTGFGLIGHLAQMLEAAGLTASLDTATVPVLAGAAEVVQRGIVSSLQRDNLGRSTSVDSSKELAKTPLYQLLFDPQTAGGLLAGVPAAEGERVVEMLRASGYSHAAVIGETRGGDISAPLISVR